MAHIILVSLDVNRAEATNSKQALEELGHTVSMYQEVAVTDEQLRSGDVIGAFRVSKEPAIHAKLLSAYNEGHPIISGNIGGSLGVHTTNVVQQAGLTGQLDTNDTLVSGFTSANYHPITQTPANKVQSLQTNTATTYICHAKTDEIAASAVSIGYKGDDLSLSVLCLGVHGLLSSLGTPFPANIAFCGFAYGAKPYTSEGKRMLDEIIKFLISGSKTVSGSIKDSLGVVAVRDVHLLYRQSGTLASSFKSGADGNYLAIVPAGYEYVAFSVDSVSAPIIYDKV